MPIPTVAGATKHAAIGTHLSEGRFHQRRRDARPYGVFKGRRCVTVGEDMPGTDGNHVFPRCCTGTGGTIPGTPGKILDHCFRRGNRSIHTVDGRGGGGT